MKVAVVCFFLAIGFVHGGLIPATTFVRAPAHDSAIIKSNRLGGNFAYSTVEGHAYAAISPVIQRVSEPVAISYNAHPVHLGYAAAPIYSSVIAAPTYQFLTSPIVTPTAGIIAQAPATQELLQQKPAEPNETAPFADDSVSVDSA